MVVTQSSRRIVMPTKPHDYGLSVYTGGGTVPLDPNTQWLKDNGYRLADCEDCGSSVATQEPKFVRVYCEVCSSLKAVLARDWKHRRAELITDSLVILCGVCWLLAGMFILVFMLVA